MALTELQNSSSGCLDHPAAGEFVDVPYGWRSPHLFEGKVDRVPKSLERGYDLERARADAQRTFAAIPSDSAYRPVLFNNLSLGNTKSRVETVDT